MNNKLVTKIVGCEFWTTFHLNTSAIGHNIRSIYVGKKIETANYMRWLWGGTKNQAIGQCVKKVPDISLGSVATQSRYGEIFDNYFYKFTAQSHSERISKTRQQLWAAAPFWLKVANSMFFAPPHNLSAVFGNNWAFIFIAPHASYSRVF